MSDNNTPQEGSQEPSFQSPDPVNTTPVDTTSVEEQTVDTGTPREPEAPRQNLNVHQEFDSYTVYESQDKIKAGEEVIPVPSHTREYVVDKIENNPDAERADHPAARRWTAVFENSFQSLQVGKQYEVTVNREGAEFRQTLKTEKGPISFASPRFAESGVKSVSGEKAQLRVRALLGLGSLISIPLWHSGFHITIKTPSDSSLIELRRRIMETKINLGRDTHGLAFSNVSSYVSGWLLDFIVDHVYDSTLKNSADLRSKILTPDLPVLFWGLACAVWPKGFHYVRALATTEGIEEKKLVSGKINIGKLMWVDNSAFTKQQKAHMSNRTSGSMTDESIQRYREDFALYKGRVVDIAEGVKINLKVPSAEEYIRSGNVWISSLSQLVESVFTDDRDDAERRNAAIAEHANATVIRQYGHWVDNVVVEESEQSDRETVDSILESMSENAEARKKFHDAVGKYIDDVTVAVIAIPEVSSDGTGLERFPNLIPLDVISVFFTLLMQRVNQILTR